MAKHFALEIADATFTFARKTAQIAAEAALDGLYAVRTSLPASVLDDAATGRSYKSLALVERAIRSIKTVDLHVRPVYHWLSDRVRARGCRRRRTEAPGGGSSLGHAYPSNQSPCRWRSRPQLPAAS